MKLLARFDMGQISLMSALRQALIHSHATMGMSAIITGLTHDRVDARWNVAHIAVILRPRLVDRAGFDSLIACLE